MTLFNVWHPAQHSKTTVIAPTRDVALDRFCVRHGFEDHAHYCAHHALTKTNLLSEAVGGN